MCRFEVRAPSDLLGATDRIHDLWFDLDDLLGQHGPVRVLVLYSDHRRGCASQILVIRSVDGVVVYDRQHVGWYDVNELVWNEGVLSITTGIPLGLSFRVSGLNLSVIDCQQGRREHEELTLVQAFVRALGRRRRLEKCRFKVRAPSDLLGATDRIHDLWFDLDDLLGQHGPVRVLVLYSDYRSGCASQILVIRSVDGVDVHDTEQVGWYDVNELVWNEGVLSITTGIPLGLSFRVSGLNLSVIDCQR